MVIGNSKMHQRSKGKGVALGHSAHASSNSGSSHAWSFPAFNGAFLDRVRKDKDRATTSKNHAPRPVAQLALDLVQRKGGGHRLLIKRHREPAQ